MNIRKKSLSFLLIFVIVLSLSPALVFGDNDPIRVDDLISSSEDGQFYEGESANLTGTIKTQKDISSVEIGLFTSKAGLTQTKNVKFEDGEFISWEFQLILPDKGDYEAGYYTVRIMNAKNEDNKENYKAESPAFSVNIRESKEKIAKSQTKPIEPLELADKLIVNVNSAPTTYTAESDDNAINIEFSTISSIATPCTVKCVPLTKPQKDTMLKNSKDYYSFYGIGDITIVDKDGKEIKVSDATATFDLDKVLKGAVPLDYKYDDDYLKDDASTDEDEEEDDFDENQVYTLGSADRFYDFDGDLFIYDRGDDVFYNQSDRSEYYYNGHLTEDEISKYDGTDDSDDADSDEDEDDSDEDWDEDLDEDSDDEDEDWYGYNVYFSNDGLYYYYFEDDWDDEPDLYDGYYYDEGFDVYIFGDHCYYYDKAKDAYFLDEEFERAHPGFLGNIHYDEDDYYHNSDEDEFYDEQTFAYIKECNLYLLNGNFYKKKGDAFYFDEDFNRFSEYTNGHYYYYDNEGYSEFYKKKSGKRVFLEGKDRGYDEYEYYPEYKTITDTFSYDGFGTGKKHEIKKDTFVSLIEPKSHGGTDWVRLISPEYVKYSKQTKEKLKGVKGSFYDYFYDDYYYDEETEDYVNDKNGYTIPRVGMTKLDNIAPLYTDDSDPDIIHLNESSGKVDSYKGKVKDSILTVTGASFSPVMVAEVKVTKNEAPPVEGSTQGEKNQSGRGVLGQIGSYNTSDESGMIIWLVFGFSALLVFVVMSLGGRRFGNR